MAYCWNEHSGWTYLKREEAAICVSSSQELKTALNDIANNPDIVKEYAKKAFDCGIRNHIKTDIQIMLLKDFNSFLENNEV